MTSQVCLQGPDIRFRLFEGKRCVSLTNPGQGVVLPVFVVSLQSLLSDGMASCHHQVCTFWRQSFLASTGCQLFLLPVLGRISISWR